MTLRRLVIALAAAAVAWTLAPSAAHSAPLRDAVPAPVGRITPQSFAIHSYQGAPGVRAGAIRLNCSPLWKTMNPAPGVYDWTELDRFLDQVEGWGYTDIVFSICATPDWAVIPGMANDPQSYFGPKSAQPPRLSAWRTFLRALVTHAKGRITAYQVWNEFTSRLRWKGTTAQMAAMTEVMYDVVDAIDPAAKVVSASTQLTYDKYMTGVYAPYLKELAKRGWPVDAITVHGYAGDLSTESLPQAILKRQAFLRTAAQGMIAAKAPRRVELWDTETNFLGKTLSVSQQQAVLARTFLDSWRMGVDRTYWYIWTYEDYDWVGVQLTSASATVGTYNRLVDWTTGARITGCTEVRGLVTCSFARGTSAFRIAYRLPLTGKSTVRVSPSTPVCRVDRDACTTGARSVSVGFVPVRIG